MLPVGLWITLFAITIFVLGYNFSIFVSNKPSIKLLIFIIFIIILVYILFILSTVIIFGTESSWMLPLISGAFLMGTGIGCLRRKVN